MVLGSILRITAPQYVEWSGTEELYPFFFESDSDWTVDVCAEVPEGYEIVGVEDDAGNLITTSDCVQTLVATEIKVILFRVVDVGSPPVWAFQARIKARHNGKTKILNLGIPTNVPANAAAWEHSQGKPFQE